MCHESEGKIILSILLKIDSSSISAKELFLSESFERYLQDTTNNILRKRRKPKIQLKIVTESKYKTAFTTGSYIQINYNYYMVQSLKSKKMQFRYLRGFNGHEVGHILFDDFVHLKMVKKKWMCGIVYPLTNYFGLLNDEDKKAYNEIKEYMKDADLRRKMLKLYLELDNILSDAFVNYQILEKVPFYSDDLKFVLALNRKNLVDRSSLKNSSESLFLFLQYLLWYSVYDYLPENDSIEIKIIKSLRPIINEIKKEIYAETRTFYYQILLCRVWEIIKPYLIKETSSNDQNSMEDMEKNNFSIRPISNFSPQYDSNDVSVPKMEVIHASDEIDLQTDYSSNIPSLTDDFKSEDVPGFRGKDYQTVLYLFAKQKEYEEKEKEHCYELSMFNKEIRKEYGDGNLNVVINRSVNPDSQTFLKESEEKEITLIANQIIDELVNIDIKRIHTEKASGYYTGKRINFPAVMRNDLKLFERNNAESKKMSLAMMLVLDESGSTKGIRNYYQKFSALIFHKVAGILKIPLGIVGHKANIGTVDVLLNVYSDFVFDEKDCLRILSMKAGNNNRDGYALTFACERLLQRNEKNKLCIYLTDGKPNAHGYGGSFAKRELQALCKKYKKEGIILVIAAIGDDKEYIKEIYKDDFLDIKNIKNIPQSLCDILKKFYQM